MAQNKVRIIGGEWRSRIITFPAAADLRPTPDRVRETLFNWLGQDLTGKTCLDLFAGSGALGFEAASRGAARVVMVEDNRQVHNALQANAQKLGGKNLELICADAVKFIRADQHVYDVIFLDPPFQKEYLFPLLAQIPARLAEGGRVYLETGKKPELGTGWRVWRSGRAGKVNFQLLKWEPDD